MEDQKMTIDEREINNWFLLTIEQGKWGSNATPLETLVPFNKGLIKSHVGKQIEIELKKKGFSRNIFGGIIFGLGWGLAGACPGPMFILLGRGAMAIIIVIIGAVLGTLLYHAIKSKLPH